MPGVVEGRRALYTEVHGAAGNLDAPDQVTRLFRAVRLGGHRHVVHDMAHSVRRKESRGQDVGVRAVELLLVCRSPMIL